MSMTPLSSGYCAIVIIDDYSRFAVVEFVRSTNGVIPVIDNIFAMFGAPGERKSDNRPPFNGGELHNYALKVVK